MLTAAQTEIIKATVPVLQAHGETITRTFYGFLFEAHPELRNIFNQAHQAQGDQPRALANAVLAYAANIDQLQNLGPDVARIAHKHCSLDILPEHYPLVGQNLLKAIGHVLGDAATPEIVDAWAAAYGQLAEIFIGVEGEMYRSNAERGWAGFKPFRVVERRDESAVIVSFTLVPVDGEPLPAHEPGQYLSVKFETGGDPHTVMRQYTISCAPNPHHYRVSVKREPGGAASNRLHDTVREGDEVLVHMPHGEFLLEGGTGPVVFLAGGIGVTPLLAMLEGLVADRSERAVTFVQAALDGSVHAFGGHIASLVANRPNFRAVTVYETPRAEDRPDYVGRLNAELLRELVPANAHVYFCGPRGFMAAVDAALESIGVAADRRHYEAFGPRTGLATPETATA
ncbi:MAG: NO-inducible flavohemoprotein [Fimbriimonas sp.]